ncbi:MAG: YaiO family outer membrane beta-barrel protein [Planctomycetota bacterium]
MRRWQVGTSYSYDWFSDQRDPWHEAALTLKRTTPIGPVIGRVSYAHRFAPATSSTMPTATRSSGQEPTPISTPASPDHELYPRYRYGADLYQSIGWGLEPSLGFRHLEFASSVSIYVATLTKYWGDWAFIGRVYVTPGSAGTSHSGHLAARRYLDDGVSYVGLRYGHGSSAEEITTLDDTTILDSDVIAADALIELGDRWELSLQASISREERISSSDLYHYRSVPASASGSEQEHEARHGPEALPHAARHARARAVLPRAVRAAGSADRTEQAPATPCRRPTRAHLAAQQRPDGARKRYQEALAPSLELQRVPGNHVYLERLAEIYDHLGRFAEEAAMWEQYLLHAPTPVEACPRISEAYRKQELPNAGWMPASVAGCSIPRIRT